MRNLINSLNIFSTRIKSILDHIECLEKLEDSVKNKTLSLPDSLAKDVISLSNSVVEYNAIIISIYGCFENYIISITSAFIDIIFSKGLEYSSLPPKLTNKYKTNIADYLNSPHRFSDQLILEDVISNYNNILSSNYQRIDKNFLLTHSGNLKIDKVFDLLNSTGIENTDSRLCQDQSLWDFWLSHDEDEYGLKNKIASHRESLFKYLNDLVDERNNVAHGWSEDSRISKYNITNDIIPFICSLSESILRLLLIESVSKYIDASDELICNIKPIKVFNNNIVCLNSCGINIKLNSYIVYEKNSKENPQSPVSKLYCAKIKNIEVDHIKVEETGSEAINVGLELDNRIKEESKILCII